MSYYIYDKDGNDPHAGYTGPLLEVCVTQYHHPDITTGQHTNGKPYIFVRLNGTKDWFHADDRMYLHHIRAIWAEFGSEMLTLLRPVESSV